MNILSNLPFTASKQKTPILFGLPLQGLGKLDQEDKRLLVSGFHHCFDNSLFDYNKEGSIGRLNLCLLIAFSVMSLRFAATISSKYHAMVRRHFTQR